MSQGNEVSIISYENGYYKAKYNQTEGFIYYPYLTNYPSLTAMKDKWHQELAAKLKRKRFDDLVKRFGPDDAKRVLDKETWIGMSSAMARASIGAPKSINSTETEEGLRQQWVYENRYLYFDEEDKLTTIQETKN